MGGSPSQQEQTPKQNEDINKEKNVKLTKDKSNDKVKAPEKDKPFKDNQKNQQERNTNNPKNSSNNKPNSPVKLRRQSQSPNKKIGKSLNNKNSQKMPLCMNKKLSTHVCLNSKCNIYPFYCMECQDNCSELHLHNNQKSESINYNQFQDRVLKRTPIISSLQSAINEYKETLANFGQIMDRFVEQELKTIQFIEKQRILKPQVAKLKKDIQKQQYSRLSGSVMACHWNQSDQNFIQYEQKQAAFLQEKEKDLKEFCKCFKIISSAKSKPQNKKQNIQKSMHFFKRFQLGQNMKISKEGSWSSNKK